MPLQMARPTRLDGISYTGEETYFITTCTLDRQKVFVNTEFYDFCRDELFALSERFGFSTDAYVFMPDHVHWMCEAQRDGAPLERFVALWKQRTGFAWSKQMGRRLWQKGYYERVLRPNDDALGIARYIVENPVRAGLVRDARDYPYVGSQRYELEHILTACQLDLKSGWHR
jgi:REP element-mobilizing transposase RayT